MLIGILDPRRRKAGRPRLHRDVLQPEAKAHEQRNAIARWLRNQTAETERGRYPEK